MKKPITHWRIVCPNFGTTGHSTHTHPKKTADIAHDAVDAMDRKMEQNAKMSKSRHSYYQSERGWRVQSQTITPWEDDTDAG